MEKRRKSKIQKWDEFGGLYEVEVQETVTYPDEIANNDNTLVKNPIRAVEDTVEQNDNSLDGIFNNLPEEKPVAQVTNADVIEADQKKKSVLEKLHEIEAGLEKVKKIMNDLSAPEREIK